MKRLLMILVLGTMVLSCADKFSKLPGTELIDSYVGEFNANDEEIYIQCFPNDSAAAFLKANIPVFECSDKEFEKTYYFRWWTFRKHVKEIPFGYVITEFLPDVPWAGTFNAISCPASHHIREGRWLRNKTYMEDYIRFWFSDISSPMMYSFPASDATWQYYLVNRNEDLIKDIYPSAKNLYSSWEVTHRDSTGLFWQIDDEDGMELSVAGYLSKDFTGYRPTINSYMYADAVAISKMADLLGEKEDAVLYKAKADTLRTLLEDNLWDAEDEFYKVIPRFGDFTKAGVRELIGYIPWMYDIPSPERGVAWRQLFDPEGFSGKYGPTTAERRDPGYSLTYVGHECKWNGPSWPFATTQTLVAMANCIRRDGEKYLTREEYFDVLDTYAKMHRRTREDGSTVCWIDENLNPDTGDWMARTMLFGRGNEINERGKDYNHSGFADLLISGLIGINADDSGNVTVDPLLPEGKWDYWCIRDVECAGKSVTVVYDRDGSRYGLGKGLKVFMK